MRMQRQLMPLSIVGPGTKTVRSIRFVPQVMTRDSVREYTGLLICGEEGVMQFSKLNFESLERISNGPDAEQIMYAPLTSPAEAVSSTSVSTSGQYVAVGTTIGTIGQYVRTGTVDGGLTEDDSRGTAMFKINDRSPYPKLAPHRESAAPAPLLSISLDSNVLGNMRLITFIEAVALNFEFVHHII